MGNAESIDRKKEPGKKTRVKSRGRRHASKIVKKSLENTKIFHVVLLGNEGCGKSTLAGQFTGNVKFQATGYEKDLNVIGKPNKPLNHISRPRTYKTVVNGKAEELACLRSLKEEVTDFKKSILSLLQKTDGGRGIKGRLIRPTSLSTKPRLKNGSLDASYVMQVRDMPSMARINSLSSFIALDKRSHNELEDYSDDELTPREIEQASKEPGNLHYLLQLQSPEDLARKEAEKEAARSEGSERGRAQNRRFASTSRSRSPSKRRPRSRGSSATRKRSMSPSFNPLDKLIEANVINSLYLPVETKYWSYLIIFDPRYETSQEYAFSIITEMRHGLHRHEFDQTSVVLFANKFDIGDFTNSKLFRRVEQFCDDNDVILVHGSALTGRVYSYGNSADTVRHIKLEWSVKQFFHLLALNMIDATHHTHGGVQKYPLREFALEERTDSPTEVTSKGASSMVTGSLLSKADHSDTTSEEPTKFATFAQMNKLIEEKKSKKQKEAPEGGGFFAWCAAERPK